MYSHSSKSSLYWNLQLPSLDVHGFPVEILTDTSGNRHHSRFAGDNTEALKDYTQDSGNSRNFKLDSHEFKYCVNLSKLLELLFLLYESCKLIFSSVSLDKLSKLCKA